MVKSSPLFIIFTTVLVDLIGFGMVIPLIGLYGRHYGGEGLTLSVLGGIYSIMQFIFSPLWGMLSDRVGRRPVLLISLAGSSLSYFLFGLAPSLTWLLAARAFGGVFAANISTAQAYIADVTTSDQRAKGMGLIGAAFGIGFTLGPPLGGIAAQFGLAVPGIIASIICSANFLFAIFRLPESLPKEKRAHPQERKSLKEGLYQVLDNPKLKILFIVFFFVTLCFSMIEQTFSLLFQQKFQLSTESAGLKTGLVLMTAGLLGAIIQGGLIRTLVACFHESRLLCTGLLLHVLAMSLFPFGANYRSYFYLVIPLSLGSALINPSLNSLISKSADEKEQGITLGVSQGLGSLARALGPFIGLMSFALSFKLPYLIASTISGLVFIFFFSVYSRKNSVQRTVKTH